MRLNGLFTAYQPFPSKTNGLTGGLMAIFKPSHGLTNFEGCEGVLGRFHPPAGTRRSFKVQMTLKKDVQSNAVCQLGLFKNF